MFIFASLYFFAATIIPAISLIALGYIDCTQKLVGVVSLVVSIGFMGVTSGSGFGVNHSDIAPKYAPVLYGISNSVAAITGFIAPTLIGNITKDVSIISILSKELIL